MLKVAENSVVFQEIPDEISLMLMISGCKNNCPNCHSQYLKQDIGEPLEEFLPGVFNDYDPSYFTAMLFMGGEHNRPELITAMKYCKEQGIKTAWYCGNDIEPPQEMIEVCDYIKVGSYMEDRGPLNKKTTNQILYKINNGELIDITYKFWK